MNNDRIVAALTPGELWRDTTIYERQRWGTCAVCAAKHGLACHAAVGFQLGVRIDGRAMIDGEGAHLARLQAAPPRVPVIPSPIFTDTLNLTTTVTFGFWDRIKILFGCSLNVQNSVETLIDRTKPAPPPTSRSWVFNPRAKPRPMSGMMLEGGGHP
jgi:hypothetical protein